MNERLDDRLQQLANGELSEREAAVINREIAADPEAQARLQQYSDMRGSLEGLREVPPDQLSRERLRERLLADGLKTQRVASGASWLWMPTAAAALVFLVYYSRLHSTQVEPRMIGIPNSSDLASVVPSPKASVLALPKLHEASPMLAMNEKPAPHFTASLAADTEPTKRRHHHAHHAKALAPAPVDSGSYLADNSASPTDAAAPTNVADSTDANSPAASPPESVVLISSDSDAKTGAQQATEETPSNVTVGG